MVGWSGAGRDEAGGMAGLDRESVIQGLTKRLRRYERENIQLATSYKLIKQNHERTVKELRDAEVYIQVLEDENSILKRQLDDYYQGKEVSE